MLERLGTAAAELPRPPASVIIFGSFARREADRTSDIDVVFVRPDEVDPDDDAWTAGIDRWRENAAATTGNDIEVIDIGLTAAVGKLSDGGQLWEEIARDGVAIFGTSLQELRDMADA
ncbi:MAG: nucleotidyltransferase domain-containing protein [Acidimicrobiales bacterium]|nr:nucleotidyltransferase domain-containing protein [Acidimicrobiales bacterium]